MQTAYKFTSTGREPTHGASDYPPVGEWSESRTPKVCESGWHVPTPEGWGRWMAAELWEVEVSGKSDRQADKESWERIRFVRQVDAWDPQAASEFAAACRDRAAAHAAYAANATDAANATANAAAAAATDAAAYAAYAATDAANAATAANAAYAATDAAAYAAYAATDAANATANAAAAAANAANAANAATANAATAKANERIWQSVWFRTRLGIA